MSLPSSKFGAQHAILRGFDLHSLDAVLQLRLWVRLLELCCTQAGLCRVLQAAAAVNSGHCTAEPVRQTL